jgi:hypothetical protein
MREDSITEEGEKRNKTEGGEPRRDRAEGILLTY